MSKPLSLSLTTELNDFVETQSGEGTLFVSPDEFIRALIREKKDRIEAAKFRESILASYQDILEGRTTEFKGSIDDVIEQVEKRNRKA